MSGFWRSLLALVCGGLLLIDVCIVYGCSGWLTLNGVSWLGLDGVWLALVGFVCNVSVEH